MRTSPIASDNFKDFLIQDTVMGEMYSDEQYPFAKGTADLELAEYRVKIRDAKTVAEAVHHYKRAMRYLGVR